MPQTNKNNRRIVLASRPQGAPIPDNFRLENAPVPEPAEGQVLLRTTLTKRMTVKGFIVLEDYGHRYPEFAKEMSKWVSGGQVKYREQVVDGLENAPEAFIGLLEGRNFGKFVIRVDTGTNL